jgi:hypothetical protein
MNPKPFKLKVQVIPEKVIENQILHYLFRVDIFAWKNQTVGIYDQTKKIYRRPNNPFHVKGVSDILGILPPSTYDIQKKLPILSKKWAERAQWLIMKFSIVVSPFGITIGRVLAIEVKSATGRASPEQIAFIDKVNSFGGLGFIARSVEDVQAALRDEGLIP